MAEEGWQRVARRRRSSEGPGVGWSTSAHPGFRHVRLADGQGRHRRPGHPHQEGRHHQRGRHALRCRWCWCWCTMKVLVLVHHRGADASKKKLRTFVYSCHYKCALQYALLFIEKDEKYKSFKKLMSCRNFKFVICSFH